MGQVHSRGTGKEAYHNFKCKQFGQASSTPPANNRIGSHYGYLGHVKTNFRRLEFTFVRNKALQFIPCDYCTNTVLSFSSSRYFLIKAGYPSWNRPSELQLWGLARVCKAHVCLDRGGFPCSGASRSCYPYRLLFPSPSLQVERQREEEVVMSAGCAKRFMLAQYTGVWGGLDVIRAFIGNYDYPYHPRLWAVVWAWRYSFESVWVYRMPLTLCLWCE